MLLYQVKESASYVCFHFTIPGWVVVNDIPLSTFFLVAILCVR